MKPRAIFSGLALAAAITLAACKGQTGDLEVRVLAPDSIQIDVKGAGHGCLASGMIDRIGAGGIVERPALVAFDAAPPSFPCPLGLLIGPSSQQVKLTTNGFPLPAGKYRVSVEYDHGYARGEFSVP